ncbi:MAG: oxygenase MpaB family protein [Actinomycetota bacterium]|nr:oxygenase MpaB family protein [Actinomycetota bacterium]
MSFLPFPLETFRLAVRRQVEATVFGDAPDRVRPGSVPDAPPGAPVAADGDRSKGVRAGRPSALSPAARAGSAGFVRDFEKPAGDPGLFGSDSVTWRVHGDLPSMLVGGIAALLLQTLHPLVMAGVAEHSAYRSDPDGRLRRTAAYIGVTTFGSTEAAERAISQVRAVHRRVRGVAPDGTPYDAGDPHVLTWVHACEVWCFLRAYRRFGPAPIGAVAADRYVAEMATLARRLGATGVPESCAGAEEYFHAVRPELSAGAQALTGAAFIVNVGGQSLPPSSLMTAAARAVLVQAAVDLLPRWAASMLGLRQPLLPERLVLRVSADALLGTLRWAMGTSPALTAARSRCAGGPVSSVQATSGAA